MDHDEWLVVSRLFLAFKGDWDRDKRDAYFHFLKDYDRELVVAAVERIAQNGVAFIPAVSEIVAAIKETVIPPTPAWSEAWRDIERIMRRATRKSPRHVGIREALEWATEHTHPVVAAFVATEGLDRLLVTEFYDPDYGPLRLRELAQRWESYVNVAEARIERGLALDAGARRSLGPGRLDTAALIAGIPGAPKQLEAGE